jgi:hypothetical protein
MTLRFIDFKTSEPQNVEGWYRYALAFYIIDRSTQKLTTGRIHYFDIRYSLFNKLRKAEIFFSIKQATLTAGDLAET